MCVCVCVCACKSVCVGMCGVCIVRVLCREIGGAFG